MPPPLHLTRTRPPALDFSRPGTPAATDYDDIYFSVDGGLEESRAVFLHGCGLPDRWQNRDVFTIAELGFGSGLNFLATWQAWLESGATGRLHFISVEAFPFERSMLEQALSHFPSLAPLSEPLLRDWPGPVKGIHRQHFGPVTLTLVHDQVEAALKNLDMRADAWFLDGFSPAKNPAMWSDDIMRRIATLSVSEARLATFTVAGAVRRALEGAGFTVTRQPGFGRKRHRLEARLTRVPDLASQSPSPVLSPDPSPTIIGNGIAGASIAYAFLRRGISARVLHDPDHIAASGNGAALIKPRFDLQDNPASRFFLSSFLYASRLYEAVGATRHIGVEHRFTSEAEADRFAKLVKQAPLGPDHFHLDPSPSDRGGLWLSTASVIDTQSARQALLGDSHVEARKIDALSEVDGPIIVASGYGVRGLLPESAFRFSRGQLSTTEGQLAHPVTYGGYAIPIPSDVLGTGNLLLGATHDRILDHDQAFKQSPQADARNLANAQDHGLNIGPEAQPFRASVRVNSPDTLPRLVRFAHEKTQQDVWVLSGLGSRGFVFAPLLGEALVSAYLGEPSPLERGFVERINHLPV